jgi:hypothetical protein
VAGNRRQESFQRATNSHIPSRQPLNFANLKDSTSILQYRISLTATRLFAEPELRPLSEKSALRIMPYPLGVYFGPTFMTAAHALEDGKVVPVAKTECSIGYQDFFNDNLSRKVESKLETLPEENPAGRNYPVTDQKQLFTEALGSIKSEAERVLGQPADVQAIVTPYHWDDGIRMVVWDAAVASGILLGGTHMLNRLPKAVFRAQDMSIGRPQDQYNVLMVDYNTNYLHFLICEVAWDVCAIEGQVQLPELGEKSALKHAKVQEGDSEDPHWSEVRRSLNTFVELAKARLGDYKFITLSGEAEETMGEMRRLLESFPDSEAKGKLVNNDSIPPLYAAAFGAAHAAKAQTDDPKTTRDFLSFPDPIPEEPRSSS